MDSINEVINLAYTTVPKTSYDDPVADLLSNVPPVVKLFDILSTKKVDKVIQISTGGVLYGTTNSLPIKETDSTQPLSPYGITKLTIEKYAYLYYQLHQVPIVSIRPSNAFGERQLPYRGQGLIATAMASLLEDREITIYGKDVVRDYIYITDLVNGIIAALDKGIPGESYNIGSGIGKSNEEVIDTLCSVTNTPRSTLTITFKPPRPFDVLANYLDCTKISAHTQWDPSYSFEEGLQQTWEWFKLHYVRSTQ